MNALKTLGREWAAVTREFASMGGDVLEMEKVLLASKAGFLMGVITAETMTASELESESRMALGELEKAQKRARELEFKFKKQE